MTRTKTRLLRSASLLFVFVALAGCTMGFGKTLVLCSPFSGRIVDGEGQPVAGIRIERHWTWGWNDKEGADSAVTDDAGRFELPLVEGSSFMGSLLPHEPDVKQRITAHGPNGDVEIWYAAKKSYDLNSELDGRPVKVVCRIDREPSDDGLYWGTCTEDTP